MCTLFRGLSIGEAEAGASAGLGVAGQHDGTYERFADDIATGSRETRVGTSFTYDPAVALYYAIGGRRAGGADQLICVPRAAVAQLGPFVDMTDATHVERLREVGASDRAVSYGVADSEFRLGAAVPAGLLTPQMLVSVPWEQFEGEEDPGFLGGSKRDFANSLTPEVWSWLAAWAARCEGREPTRLPDGTIVRVSPDEAGRLRGDTTAYMRQLGESLHALHKFTHAAATDGTLMPPPVGSRSVGRTAYGTVSYASNGGRTVRGGGMPAGSSVQDAELAAIVDYLQHVWVSAGEGGEPASVLVYSDCFSVLRDIETARRARSGRELRSRNRRQMLERVVALAGSERMRSVVFIWVRGHGGVLPNHVADAVAKAALRSRVVDLPRLLAGGRQRLGESLPARVSSVRYEVRDGVGGVRGGW